MRRLICLPMLLIASALPAQSFWNSSVRTGPQFFSYKMKAPLDESVSQLALPIFVVVPILPALTVDVGTSFAMVRHERITLDAAGNRTTTTSELSGLTDTQLRANYTFGQDFVVLTAGLNVPTGSATVDVDEVEAASRIGSDFLTFPVSGFGSGLGMTGGVAVARPLGAWSLGFGASLRQSMEYEPFRDAAGTPTRFTPGPEYRARMGADHPFGTGRISFGLMYSKFGDDKANALTYNTGDRYVAQFALNNSLGQTRTEYSFVVWNLYRTTGRQIDQSPSPSGNIANAMLTVGVPGPGGVSIEPSIETRVWAEQNAETSFLGTLGIRLFVDRGFWAIVPGAAFTAGTMQSAGLSGFRATLGMRLGG